MSFSLKNVSYSYVDALDQDDPSKPFKGISIDTLEISKTGITAIIGPSGSGKTTLLSVLAGFVSPTVAQNGHLKLRGQDFRTDGHAAGRVSFIFQSPFLLGAASNLTNILQGHVASQSDCPENPFRRRTCAIPFRVWVLLITEICWWANALPACQVARHSGSLSHAPC